MEQLPEGTGIATTLVSAVVLILGLIVRQVMKEDHHVSKSDPEVHAILNQLKNMETAILVAIDQTDRQAGQRAQTLFNSLADMLRTQREEKYREEIKQLRSELHFERTKRHDHD